MKQKIFLTLFISFLISCENEPVLNPLEYNPNITVQQNLVNGVPVLEILNYNEMSSLYGIEYDGGYIFHINEASGNMIVATDYSSIGDVAWGDVFELDTSH